MKPDSLRVAGLRFAYPRGPQILDDVNLAIASGERVAIIGPNGSGKTTLLNHLTGILEAQSGSVEVGDLRLGASTVAEIRRRVGVVFQDADDQLFMPTVRQDVAFGPANLGVRGADLDQRVADALDAVHATDLVDRSPHHLSVGEKRRVTLATVLAMDPTVLVLDEPSAGLDPTGRRELLSLLSTLSQTQIVVTHDLLFAIELCRRAALLSNGRIVADGSTVDILSDASLLGEHRLELPIPLARSALVALARISL